MPDPYTLAHTIGLPSGAAARVGERAMSLFAEAARKLGEAFEGRAAEHDAFAGASVYVACRAEAARCNLTGISDQAGVPWAVVEAEAHAKVAPAAGADFGAASAEEILDKLCVYLQAGDAFFELGKQFIEIMARQGLGKRGPRHVALVAFNTAAHAARVTYNLGDLARLTGMAPQRLQKITRRDYKRYFEQEPWPAEVRALAKELRAGTPRPRDLRRAPPPAPRLSSCSARNASPP